MNNDRRYFAAPPLRIDLRTRENVYTGIEPANNFWRAKIQSAFDFSQALKELMADAAYSRCQILAEIHGHVENPNVNQNRPYMQKMATAIVFGRGQLSNALDAAIAQFKVSKRTADEPGYVASGNIIVLTHAIVKLAYAQEAEGGAMLGKEDIVKLNAKRTEETMLAANPPKSIRYLRNAQNVCFFRCLFHLLSGPRKLWFKELGNVTHIKRSIGLDAAANVPVSKAFQFCDMHNIELKLTIFDGDYFTEHVSPRHDTNRYRFRDIRLVLDVERSHYMVFFQGRIKVDPTASKVRLTICDRCNAQIDINDAAPHHLAHEIADAETRLFETDEVTPEREEGEDIVDYGKRYCAHFVNLITSFITDQNTKSILWFAGPGGCGKSHIIKSFIEKNPTLTIDCVSHTGVAAQNIGGRTIESYLSSFGKACDLTHDPSRLPDVLIIDEISMTSMQQFERINNLFCKLNAQHSLFGGVKIIIMGDFSQLEVISTSKQPADAVIQSPLFTKYAVPIPMLYGFRYKDDPPFYDFLCRMRENKVDFESFRQQQWKFCTRMELATNFESENRPVFMAFQNKHVAATVKLIHDHDTRNGGELVPVPLQIYSVSLDGHVGLRLPASLHLNNLFQTSIDPKKVRLKPVTSTMDDLFTRALVEELPTNSLWVKDSDCQINTTLSEFYKGQKLLITKNYCDNEGEMMNGQEVYFEEYIEEDDILVVKAKDGSLGHLNRIWRGLFKNGVGYVAHGFPIQPASGFTGHKAQGKTFETAAIYLLDKPTIPTPHLYYVMLSRCVRSSNLYFIFESDVDAAYDMKVSIAYDRLFGSDGRAPLVTYNKMCTDIMTYSKLAKPIAYYGVDLEHADADTAELLTFPQGSNLQLWQPSLPAPLGKSKYGNSLLFDDMIVYDIETGAASESVNHPDFFDGETYISNSNAARLTMTEWMISFYHIIDGDIVWLHNCGIEPLEAFSKYQQEDGQIIFHRGEFEDDPDTDKWCSEMFFEYVMAYAHVKRNYNAYTRSRRNVRFRKARNEDNPCYIVGFNIDSFDTKSILQRFTDMDWPNDFFPYIIPNSGTAITQLQICSMVKIQCQGDETRSIREAAIVTHDVFRLLGCMSSLDASHKSYVRSAYTRMEFLNLVKTQTYSHDLQMLLMDAYDVGKGDLPHLLTQREGHKVTLSRDVKTYRLEDYPEKDREALQDPATRTYAFFDKSRSYMKRDLLTTLALYVAVNKMVMDSVDRCCLVLNTAQQYTTTYFFHHYAGATIKKNSDGSKPVVESTLNKRGTRTLYKTNFYLLNAHEDKMVKQATYGGKTLPRVIEWNREQGEGDYLQLDESGMYADRLQRCEYPYGKHRYSVSPHVCGRVMRLWQETLGDPDRLRYPRNTSFPFMFICRATLKMPALCIDPGVAYITGEEGELQWSICDKDGVEQGVRTQYLTNVDLATKMAEGAELIEVTEVLFWEKFGKIFESYLETINTIKYTSSDTTKKGSAKLAANAFYGATLKTDHHTVFVIFDPNNKEQEDKDCERIDWSQVHNRTIFSNGKMGIQAKAKIDADYHASRPNYTGAFVLSHSKYKLSQLVRVAHGPNFLPTTKVEAIMGLRFQCLYGDTDSLYLHSTHLARVLEYDASQTDPTSKLLFDQMQPGDTTLTKLGRFCDEPSNDCGCGDLVNFRQGNYGKVVRFASNAPKSYTVTYDLPNGTTKFKSRLKGVKTNGSRIFVDILGDLDHLKRGREVAFAGEDGDGDDAEQPQQKKPKKDRVAELQKSETTRRIEMFDASTTSYAKSSQQTHEAMYDAIVNDDLVLRTRCQGTLKNFGLFPQPHERSIGPGGELQARAAYDFTVTNVQRDVCGDILTRRRRLTGEEIAFLGLSEYDANRILVPYGYNYDRSLFSLQ